MNRVIGFLCMGALVAAGCGQPDPDEPVVQLSEVAGQPTEAGGSATFDVTLSAPPLGDELLVAIAVDNPSEAVLDVAELRFTPGDYATPQTVTVTGVDDNIDDGDQTVLVSLPDHAQEIALINLDDDTAGVSATATTSTPETSECGTAFVFEVVLDSEPLGDVSLDFFVSEVAEASIDPASLVFTSSDWNTPQTVTVTGLDDGLADGDVPYTVSADPMVSTDPLYDGIQLADTSLTNTSGTLTTIDAVQRGWWNNLGDHTASNNNTLTGHCAGCGADFYRAYFQFDLSGIVGAIGTPVLRLEVESYDSPDAAEDFSVWDVSTDAATLEANGNAQVAIYNDLGEGVTYGNGSIANVDVGSAIEFSMNADAVADINAAVGGIYSVGVSNDTAGNVVDEYVRFSASNEVRTHQLDVSVCPSN